MGSLKDIASELGVSYTLVSKVLRGKLGTTRVSERARKAILAKAKEVDYKANPAAVALKGGRKGAVGIFLHHLGTPGSEISERLVQGLAKGLDESGLRMWLRYFTTNEEFYAACDGKLQREVDGLIVGGCHHPRLISNLRGIEAKGLPVVSVFFDSPGPRRDPLLEYRVSVDSERQGYLATGHLLAAGCRRLVQFQSMKSRAKGFERAHKDAGISAVRDLLLPITDDFSIETGERLVRKLLHARVRFDGIVCHSDAQAVGAINELVRHGVDVPGKVKVTGVDNSPLADSCIVPVTSVTAGVRQTGLKAVEILLKRIAGEPARAVTIEPRLVIRRSSSAAL